MPLPSGSGFFLAARNDRRDSACHRVSWRYTLRLRGKIMKEAIAGCLARHGWHKDRIVDAFSKTFETVVAPKRASIWLSFDHECDRWWLKNGEFTSAGENVLAGTFAIFPTGMPDDEVEDTVAALVAGMEGSIAGAYSVRLLGQRGLEGLPSRSGHRG